jgi:hypothetical protein
MTTATKKEEARRRRLQRLKASGDYDDIPPPEDFALTSETDLIGRPRLSCTDRVDRNARPKTRA